MISNAVSTGSFRYDGSDLMATAVNAKWWELMTIYSKQVGETYDASVLNKHIILDSMESFLNSS